MIFVLLGTQDAPFTRMTDLIKEMVSSPTWNETIIIQSGTTVIEWQHPCVQTAAFFEKGDFQTYFQEARVIVTHGGAGTMFEALQAHKKTIAIPRLSKYGEHVDDHQLELTAKLSELGYLEQYHTGKLDTLIEAVNMKKFEHYTSKAMLVTAMQRRLK